MLSVFVLCLWFVFEFSKSVKIVSDWVWVGVCGCWYASAQWATCVPAMVQFGIGICIEGQYSGELPILCWVGLLQIQDKQEASHHRRSNHRIELN